MSAPRANVSIAYTNGNAIFLLGPDGQKERLLNESMIEQVCFVPGGGALPANAPASPAQPEATAGAA